MKKNIRSKFRDEIIKGLYGLSLLSNFKKNDAKIDADAVNLKTSDDDAVNFFR